VDWDLSSPELYARWDAGDTSAFHPYIADRRSIEREVKEWSTSST
jgi:hypothetical protein